MDTSPGHLYLGALLLDEGEKGEMLQLEASDLTTHGVIVGMTGSGKTGLAIDLLEEALLSGIPALIIDPKGDMTNLLLNFPDLAPADFRPWVDESVARREGITPDDLAQRVAGEWKEGLSSWEIGPERMRRLKERASITVYTPGSNSGVPLNVLGSLVAPVDSDTEAMRDEVEGYVSSLLVLAGIDSDPISGAEHILLASIIENEWAGGRSLDLASLIGLVQQPPFRKLGVFELDAFIPPKDRTALAMKLNGLVASPSFAAWREGEPLDIETMLFGGEGTAAAVIYLAHLSETERQFLVTLLLSKLVTYMRSRQGSSELRLLTYMDEVAGFAPPTAEPPSKRPIMVLAKQARAFGFGMVLTTQNPMDFDYKVMSNAGTWAIGRLQTERDKARILEAMQSAAGSVDVDLLDRQISGLGKRQFVLHTTGGKPPRLFTTRWAMSYLAGPLSKQQVEKLTEHKTSREPAVVVAPPVPTPAPRASEEDTVPVAPTVAAGVAVTYLDPAAPWAEEIGAMTGSSKLSPVVAATVNLVYDDTRAGINHSEVFEAILTDPSHPLSAETLVVVDHDPRDFHTEIPSNARYQLAAPNLDQASFWKDLERDLISHLVSNRQLKIWKNPGLKLYSRVGERESDFRARCIAAAGEENDKAIAGLREKYGARIDRVRDQLVAAQRRMADLEADVAARRQQEVMSGAGDLLGALLGGRRRSSISRAASRRSQTQRTEARRDSAVDSVADKQADLEALEADLAQDIELIRAEWDEKAARIEEAEVALEKVDVRVSELKLVWVPTG
jgi:hypothetical protein